MITREFNLYLHAGHSIPLVINANQYDHGEQWLFTLYNSDGTKYVPSSGAIVGIKSDNLGIINSGSVDSDGRVVINETQQMTAAVGKAVFELVIDDGTHGTANFVVLVEPKPGDNADLSESDISMIEEAVEAAANIKPYGSPLVASTVAGMTDETKVYVYTGSETGYTSGHWYYYDGSDWADGGVYNSVAVQTDTTLAISGVAADSKKVGDEISALKSEINTIIAGGMGLKDSVKQALLAMFNVCMTNSSDSDDLYSQLYHALYDKEVLSISAVFNQGANVIYDTDSLDDLKQYLTVTANYDDGTSGAVTVYTLSGELTQGTSTITVTYQEKTATFTVTVTHQIVGWYYPFNDSLLSDGTEDFGFTGVANYSTGVNGKAYYHQVGTEGDASTDPNGIYATGLTKVPSLASDFTISFWYKGVNQEVAQRMFFATKQTDPVVPSSSVTNVATEEGFNNLATGWSLNTSTTVGSRYCGSRIYWFKGTSQYYLRPELFIESNQRWGIGLVPPSGIDLSEWHHYALTRKNGVLRMFFDGTKLFDYNISQAFIFPDQVAIGCGFGDDTSNISLAAGNGYSGMVDDLFFAEYCKWEATFDPSEITY